MDDVHGDFYAKKVIICKIFQIDPQVRMLYNKHIILIFNQPIDKFGSYNAATRRQASLPGGKPACGRFPRLAAFYLPPLSKERSKISIKSEKIPY